MFFEIGLPHRIIVDSEEKALDIINKNLLTHNIYFTVYRFKELKENGKINYDSGVINKLFFDLDENDCFEDAKRLHEYLSKKNIFHSIFMSGRGMHIIIYTTTNVKNKKDAVFNSQNYFIKKLDLNVDKQVLGDLARLRRVPNTFNLKAKRFCVPITGEELMNLNSEEIYNLAKCQRFFNSVIGGKLFNLEHFDTKIKTRNGNDSLKYNIESISLKISNEINLLNGITRNIEMPEFLFNLLKSRKWHWNKENGWRVRALIILWLRDKGLNIFECEEILKKFLTAEEFYHCKNVERQIEYLYKRDISSPNPMVFPTVNWLLANGFELTENDVKMVNEFYLKV